jgi:hypothetical protein
VAVLLLLQAGCGGSSPKAGSASTPTTATASVSASTAPKTSTAVRACVSASGFPIVKVTHEQTQFGLDVVVTTVVPEDTATPVHLEVFPSSAAASRALPGAEGVGSSAGYETSLIGNVLLETPADTVKGNVQKLTSCA